MDDFLKVIENDLASISHMTQMQMRSVAGNADCSSCMQPVVSSINNNLYRVLSKIRDYVDSHKLYFSLIEKYNSLPSGEEKSLVAYLLSDIQIRYVSLNKEVNNSFISSYLLEQVNSGSFKSGKERELILSLLPNSSTPEEVDQKVIDYLESHPNASNEETYKYVIERLFCNQEDLTNAIKNRLRKKTASTD